MSCLCTHLYNLRFPVYTCVIVFVGCDLPPMILEGAGMLPGGAFDYSVFWPFFSYLSEVAFGTDKPLHPEHSNQLLVSRGKCLLLVKMEVWWEEMAKAGWTYQAALNAPNVIP